MALKQCMNHADIDIMTQKLCYLHVASRCAKMVFGYEGRMHDCPTFADDNIHAMYVFFSKCKVFSRKDNSTVKLDDNVFTMNAVPELFNNRNMTRNIVSKREKG